MLIGFVGSDVRGFAPDKTIEVATFRKNVGESAPDQPFETEEATVVVSATPAEGWDVKDQVGHLAYFDDRAHESMTDGDGFVSHREEVLSHPDFADRMTAESRRFDGTETLAWFRRARAALVAAAAGTDPSRRVPWYGPDMSAASSITARIMETWAHGQDVADGLGARRQPTDRLRHIAFIGVRALPNSYQARGRPVPEAPVRVELRAPGGDVWAFGPEDAPDTVRGPALDFCLAVTQRRHLDDLDLAYEGPVATEWLSIAQAFAGPPGPGRRPGQFRT